MSYDILVIGAGPGGYVSAIRAAQLGMKVGLVERSDLGGICLNWGCIPTKALLKSAQVFDYLRHAQDYGIALAQPADAVRADWPAMVTRSRQVADGMNKGVRFLLNKHKVDVIAGSATVLPDRQLRVEMKDGSISVHQARHVLIATGARSRQLPQLPQDGRYVIGYRQALVLEKLPKRLVIVGSGAIGIEFAYLFASVGVQVTLLEMQSRIAPLEDEDISAQIERSLKKQGVAMQTACQVQGVDTYGNECKVTVHSRGQNTTIDCDVVLSAAGIEANVEGLGLEAAGIAIERGRIRVDNAYRTSAEGYYAIGDCIGTQALAHVASAEGIACVEQIAGQHVEPIDYANIPSCTYCQPEIASVGLTEAAARAAGHSIRVGKFPFSASGKAKAAGASDGFVKLIFDSKHDILLGAHMIGANVTELISEAVVARKLETTAHEIIKAVHPHPTISEAVMEAAAAAYGEAIHI